MKTYIIPSVLIIGLFGCRTEKKSEEVAPAKELSILEKVAHAHGYENWKNVTKIRFTFNVERDTTHFERTWIWDTKTQDIVAISATDTVTYNRNNMDSLAHKTNGGFINDKYWLMAPYNLIWDQDSFNFQHLSSTEAPISKKSMQRLTVVYGNEGGYTPGDAYDFFLDEGFMVREWIFRRGNDSIPTMTTSWENYVDVSGLQLGTAHNTAEGNFKLHFTNIVVDVD